MPESSDARLQGLRGWLIFVAIGLCIQPLILVKTLADNLGAFKPETWQALTTPGSRAYHPLWAPLLVAEVAVNVGLLLGSGLLLYLFFTKKRIFPKAVIAFMVANLGVVLGDQAGASAIPQARAQIGPNEYRQIGRAVVAAAIWIPYFLRSKRVHATFVN
jgi:hypothetical protein